MLLSDQVLEFIEIAVQIFIGLAVIRSGRIIAKAQYMRSLQDSWTDYNKLVINDEKNLNSLKEMVGSELSQLNREHYVSLVLLNVLHSAFLGTQLGFMEKKYLQENVTEILAPALEREEFYKLSQSRGYHPKFKKLCQKLREQSKS
jgi:hypothetical protein